MKNPAAVPHTSNKPKFAENITNARQVKAGQILLNVTSIFGNEKLSDILFQIAVEKIEQKSIGAASYPCYNNYQTEVKIAKPALYSQFGGKL